LRLTDLTIKALRAPREGAKVYFDDVLCGFGVRVSCGGTKSFVLTHGPRHQRETVGRVGIITLQDARAEAKRRLAEYTLGKTRPQAIAWDAAKAEYLAARKRELKPRVIADYTYILNRHFKYGDTRLSELSPHDLRNSLTRLQETPAEHQHAFVVVRAFLNWAYRQHYLDRSPMERMQAPHPYRARQRVLSDTELKLVWHAAGNDTFGRIAKVLILTGQRVGEIIQLRGAMIGEDTITIPSWLAKNSREHVIPLGERARDLLQLRHAPNACIFPAAGKQTPFSGRSVCKQKLDSRSGVQKWTLHDLRRTFASGMASIGVPLTVIERLLNHVSGSFGGIVGVYQRYNFMPEMRQAIRLWEAHVAKLVEVDEPYLPRLLTVSPKLLSDFRDAAAREIGGPIYSYGETAEGVAATHRYSRR
jgi:integrase